MDETPVCIFPSSAEHADQQNHMGALACGLCLVKGS